MHLPFNRWFVYPWEVVQESSNSSNSNTDIATQYGCIEPSRYFNYSSSNMDNGWDTDTYTYTTATTTNATTSTDTTDEQQLQQQQQQQQQCVPCAIARDSCNYTHKAATAVTTHANGSASNVSTSHNSSNGTAAKVNKADLSHKYPLRQGGGEGRIIINNSINNSNNHSNGNTANINNANSSSSTTITSSSSSVSGNGHTNGNSHTTAGVNDSADSSSASVTQDGSSDSVPHNDDNNTAAATTRYTSVISCYIHRCNCLAILLAS
jgi:hypothetical protein